MKIYCKIIEYDMNVLSKIHIFYYLSAIKTKIENLYVPIFSK